MNLNEALKELLKTHSKREIILALESITAEQSLERFETMKHVDKVVE